MTKPSPAQARLLKALHRTDGVIIITSLFYGRKSYSTLRLDLAPEFRMATIMACIDKGFLKADTKIEVQPNPHASHHHAYYCISEKGIKALANLTAKDFESKKREGLTDAQITEELMAKLAARFSPDTTDGEWVFVPELSVATGYVNMQRLDGWAINCWPSNKFRSLAFEVKASRSDLLHELKHPHKSAQARQLSNEFYFVTPHGLFKDKDEVPDGAGLMELINGKLIITVKAKFSPADPPTWGFLASALRKNARAGGSI